MLPTRRRFTTMALAGGTLVAAPYVIGRAAAAQTLKLAFADTRNHPLFGALQTFAAAVKQRTNGELEIQVFSIGELGSQANILTSLQTGIIDFCAHTSGFIDTILPQFQLTDLPFLFQDEAAAEKVLDGPIGKKLLDMMPAKGIYGLGYGHWGWRVVSTVGRQVIRPDDMKGLKIRVQPGPIFAGMFRALGASPIAIDYSEVYLALSQHTIEAIETPIISVPTAKHDEVVKFINVTRHVYNAGALMASKRKFDALAKPNQEILREAVVSFSGDWRRLVREKTEETAATLKQKGIIIGEIDRAEFRKQTESVYRDFRDVIGADLVAAIQKEVG